MLNLENVKSFFANFNKKCEKFLSFEKSINDDAAGKIQGVENESRALVSQMENNLKKYIEQNFTYVASEVNKDIEVLVDAFKNDFDSVKVSVPFDDKSSKDEVIARLQESVRIFNELIQNLNSNKLELKKSKAGTPEKRQGSQKGQSYDFLTRTNIDTQLVHKIFVQAKEIFALTDVLSEIYKKEFNISSFKKEVTSKKTAYIDEISQNAKTQIETELFQKFQTQEACKEYVDFFSKMDEEAKSTAPDVQNGSNEFKENFLLGYLNFPTVSGSGSVKIAKACDPMKKRVDKSGKVEVPLIASLKDKGNILISLWKDEYSKQVKDFVNQLILEFLVSYPARRIHFKLVDINDRMGFAPFSALKKISDNILLDGIVRDEKQLEDAIESVKKIKFATEDRLGAEGLSNIFEYNAKYEAAPLDVYVFVLVDFPSKMDSSLVNKVRDIMLNGKNDGVFTILIDNYFASQNDYLSMEAYINIIEQINKCSYLFVADKDEIRYCEEREKMSLDAYRINNRHNSISSVGGSESAYSFSGLPEVNMNMLRSVVEALKTNAEQNFSKPIPLTDMFDYIDKQKAKSICEEMEIPFGLCGGDVQTLKLTNQSGPHAALIGTSGSGKSVLFHTLILDACYKYSPDELNFYLLDFKGGVEFKYYQNNKLPHIKVIGLTNDLNDGLAILASINKEITTRKQLFNDVGVSNIESYYKAGYKIPRLFVIIDEIQEILVRDERIGEKALGILSEILAIGRSFGINVLWGSQSVPQISGINAKIMNNITNRICLKVANSDYAINMFGDSKSLKAVENLNRAGIVGLGVIRDERTGASVNEFRVAYSSEGDERLKYLERILEKWKDVKCEGDLYIVENDLVPDHAKDDMYCAKVDGQMVDGRAFDSYAISLGTEYVSGKRFPLEIQNSKENENVLMVGANVDLLRDMMGFALLSVAINSLADKDFLSSGGKIYYSNKEGLNPKFSGDLYNLLPKEMSQRFEVLGSDEKFFECIKKLYCIYLERKEFMDNSQIPENYSAIYVFVHSLQYLSDLFEENRPLDEDDVFTFDGGKSKNLVKFNSAFKTLLKKGGNCGIHFVLSMNSIDAIREIHDDLRAFNYKFGTKGANISSLTDLSAVRIPSVSNDRVVLFINENDIEKVRPYRFDEKVAANQQWAKDLLQKYLKIKEN